MTTKAIEMLIEPGAEKLITQMGRRMKTKARSKVIDRAVSHIRDDFHNSDVTAWFSEVRFAPSRRTTVRLSEENADYLNSIAQTVDRGVLRYCLIWFTLQRLIYPVRTWRVWLDDACAKMGSTYAQAKLHLAQLLGSFVIWHN